MATRKMTRKASSKMTPQRRRFKNAVAAWVKAGKPGMLAMYIAKHAKKGSKKASSRKRASKKRVTKKASKKRRTTRRRTTKK